MTKPESTTPWWKCSNCGYMFRDVEPPVQCPSCHARCVFIDATCYTPDCGGPESSNPDPRVGA
ncbi:MAG TPA: hypothetical protein PKO09_01385 [Anaerolineae bacterium]|nr:hypothetical protein [Anaerolineae bacterium]